MDLSSTQSFPARNQRRLASNDVIASIRLAGLPLGIDPGPAPQRFIAHAHHVSYGTPSLFPLPHHPGLSAPGNIGRHASQLSGYSLGKLCCQGMPLQGLR